MELLADIGPWGAILTISGIFAIFSIGLQVQVGHGGVDNFGQVGFFAIGAYASAILVNRYDWNLWLSAVAAIAIAVVVSMIVVTPAIRLRGDFLAITLIAFSEIVRNIAINERQLTMGALGIDSFAFRDEVMRPLRTSLRADGIEVDRLVPMLVTVWVLVFVVATVTWLLLRTPWGRVMRAVREDDAAVRALGKNAFLYKAQAMGLGAACAALAGVLYGWYQVHFSPTSFEPILTFIGFVIIIAAGVGSIWGAVVMSVVIQGFLMEGSR
ncbi:MAG: branched-chain amino acid ABC transporter permease, partial [Gaiellales bacterium]